MIPNISPKTKKLSQDFLESNLIYIIDHMPFLPDTKLWPNKGMDNYFTNTIVDLLDDYGIEWRNKIFLADSYLLFEDFPNFFIDIEKNYFIYEAKTFLPCKVKNFTNNELKYKFTFMSNKTREHRIFSSMIIANLFDKDDIAYSFIESPHTRRTSKELMFDTKYKFDPTCSLPSKYFNIRTNTIEKLSKEVYDYAGLGNNSTVYDFLYEKIFMNSATSVITEPCFREKGNQLSEKTIMAIYSGHFMIWPGSWKLPETVKKLGFDIFDDIIDHSYQYIEHPGERVAEAFLRNIDFLNDISLQIKCRNEMESRLLDNLHLIRDLPKLRENILNFNSGLESIQDPISLDLLKKQLLT